MKDLVIIKIGGSVITDKKTDKPVFKSAVVKRICSEIAKAKKQLNFDLIIVHGAGSFAHPPAKKYRLNEGYFGAESAKGFAIVKKIMHQLNILVLEKLHKVGIDAITVDVSDISTTTNGKISKFDVRIVSDLLQKGITPVLFGSVVIDSKKGISILSGDQTTTYLAKKLGASKAVFVSDVKGIYDKNPKDNSDAKLIKNVDSSNLKLILNKMTAYNKNDVTGEMKGKILAIKQNMPGIPTIIVSGLIPNCLRNALLNRIDGTRIIF